MKMYQIFVLHHAYSPDLQGMNAPHPLREQTSRGNAIEYETIDEAREVIAEMDAEVYVTDNNESGRPTYLVVESVAGDYVADGRHEDMSNYDWDNADCDCGECNICLEMMIEQDREYLLGEAVYKS